MVRREAIAAAIQDHRGAQGIEACFQLANNLANTGFGILVVKYVGKIKLGGVALAALALTEHATSKLRAAGADEVISPYQLGGTWMAQAMTSPLVTDFLKIATGVNPLNYYMEEVQVRSGSSLAGQTLRDSPIRREHGVICPNRFSVARF